MVCPHCHNENKYDSLTCDFCMQPLPMSKEREEEIKKIKKIEKQAALKNSLIKLIGTILGLLAIIIVIIVAWLNTRG
jgi:uncharacterized membrane protein YvbJ